MQILDVTAPLLYAFHSRSYGVDELKSRIGTYIIQQVMHVSDTSAPLLYYFYSRSYRVDELKSRIGYLYYFTRDNQIQQGLLVDQLAKCIC